MNIKKEIRVPIYNAKIIISITDDLPSSIVEYSDVSCENDVAMTLHFNTPLSYIMLFDVRKMSHMAISHEACHVTHRIMNDVGIEHTLLNDETEAYLQGYIINKIYKVVKTNKLMCYEK